MIRVVLSAVLMFATTASVAQFIGTTANFSKYYTIGDDVGFVAGNSNTAGKTQVSCALVGGQKTLIFLTIGQSNGANYITTPYTPGSSLVQQLNVYDGNCYQYKDPALGVDGTGGSVWGRVGQEILNGSTAARVIFIPVNIGGSSISNWSPSGPLNQRIQVAAKYARLNWGVASNGSANAVSGVLQMQGETDNFIGTSSANYQASSLLVQGTWQGYGFSALPYFIAKETIVANVASATIQGAQAALVNNGAFRYAGPDIDSLTGGTNRQGDGTHLTDTGSASAATLWNAIIAPQYPFLLKRDLDRANDNTPVFVDLAA